VTFCLQLCKFNTNVVRVDVTVQFRCDIFCCTIAASVTEEIRTVNEEVYFSPDVVCV
jgi:hypothetical protein